MSKFRSIFLNGIAWKFVFYLTSFCLNILLANYLGASESGLFFYLLNNLSIIIFVLSFGVDSSLNYFNARKEIPYTNLFLTGLIWSITAGLVFFIFHSFWRSDLIPPIANPLFIVLYVSGGLLTSTMSALFFSSNDHLIPNLIPGIINLLVIVLVISLFTDSAVNQSNKMLFQIYLASTFITGVFLAGLSIRKGGNRFASLHSFQISKKFVQYSWAVFAANIFFTLLLKSDILLVKYLCSDADLGNYIQTGKFLQAVLILPTLASFTLFPLITQGIYVDNGIEAKIGKLISLYIFISFSISILITIVGYWMFPILYGPSFSKMYYTFLLLIPGVVSLAASYPLTPFFAAKNLNRVIVYNSLIATGIMFGIDLMLVPRISIYGAALGSSIAYLFYFFSLLFHFKKLHDYPISHLFLYKKLYFELQSYFKKERVNEN